MSEKKQSQAPTKNEHNKIQLVEIDHEHRFAAELMRGNANVNLSQMARPFGKKVKDWLRTEESKCYIEAISVGRKCLTADLVEVRQGGTPDKQGTWCNDYRIALRFAQWLSPKFSIMVDEAILKLLTGSAVMAEPINGIEPMMSGGKAWYNYRDAIESMGRKRTNSASKRKSRYPLHFMKRYGRNFISAEYFNHLKSISQWQQLTLNFTKQ